MEKGAHAYRWMKGIGPSKIRPGFAVARDKVLGGRPRRKGLVNMNGNPHGRDYGGDAGKCMDAVAKITDAKTKAAGLL